MKHSSRRTTLSGVYRFVAAALVVLWGVPLVAFWSCPSGAAPALPSAAPPTQPSALAAARVTLADEHAAEAAHREHCSCANCPGRTHCCCSSAESVKDGFVLRGVCDNGTTIVAGMPAVKFVPATATRFVPQPEILLPLCREISGNDRSPSRAPAPTLLPPRLA